MRTSRLRCAMGLIAIEVAPSALSPNPTYSPENSIPTTDAAAIQGESITSSVSPFSDDAGAPGLSGVTDGGGGPAMNGSSSGSSFQTGIGGSATGGNTSVSGNIGSTARSSSTGPSTVNSPSP